MMADIGEQNPRIVEFEPIPEEAPAPVETPVEPAPVPEPQPA